MNQNENTYTLITGASGGIGYEFARIFARDGHNLVLVARNEKKLEAIKDSIESNEGVSVLILPCDLSKKDSAKAIYDETQKRGITVDHLVNNAGFGDLSGYLDRDWNQHMQMAQLNMITLMQFTYLYGKSMRANGFGHILNVSSVAAMSAGPNMAMYYASKAFVRSLSEAVSEELRGTGVTVTALCPGPVATGFEKAAHMSGKNFFSLGKPASPAHVAEYGYRKMLRGSALAYPNLLVHAANIGSRLVPRSVTRKVCMRVNGVPQK